MKKIELNLLSFILMEAFFLLFFFKESILNVLAGFVLGIILIYLTKKIKINIFFKILLLLVSLSLGYISLFKICNFISFNLLKNYSYIIIIITFLLVSFFLASKGYHTYIKALEIIFYFFIFLKVLSFILIIPNINFNNFYIDTNLNYHFLYLVFFLLFLHLSIKFLTDTNIEIKSYLISFTNPLIIKFITILVIGNTLFNLYEYPYVNVLKRIKYLEFIERMEGILSFEYLITFIFFYSFIVLLIKELIKKIYKNKHFTNI